MKKNKFYSYRELHEKWMKNPRFRRAWEDLEPEYQVARAMIAARIKKKMSQAELARKAKTGQAAISRLENMNASPSLGFLKRVAKALDTKIQIQFLPPAN